MDEETRVRVREKQDRLLALARTMGIHDSLRVSTYWPGSPRLCELRDYIFPEFEAAIDSAISYLTKEVKEDV